MTGGGGRAYGERTDDVAEVAVRGLEGDAAGIGTVRPTASAGRDALAARAYDGVDGRDEGEATGICDAGRGDSATVGVLILALPAGE